jgi:hypothetical protein
MAKITTLKDALLRIDELEGQLKIYTESPFVESYISTLTFINSTDKNIIDKVDDMMTVDNKVIFEMAHKYQTEKIPYFEQLDWLRKKMSPEQVEELENKVNEIRVKKQRIGTAEKMAMNGVTR